MTNLHDWLLADGWTWDHELEAYVRKEADDRTVYFRTFGLEILGTNPDLLTVKEALDAGPVPADAVRITVEPGQYENIQIAATYILEAGNVVVLEPA